MLDQCNFPIQKLSYPRIIINTSVQSLGTSVLENEMQSTTGCSTGFSLLLEKLGPGKMGEGIFQSGNFEQTGKSQKNLESRGSSDKCYIILVIFK